MDEINKSYDLLLSTIKITVGVIEDFKNNKIEQTDLSLQIGIIQSVIDSFKQLQDDLVKISKKSSTTYRGSA